MVDQVISRNEWDSRRLRTRASTTTLFWLGALLHPSVTQEMTDRAVEYLQAIEDQAERRGIDLAVADAEGTITPEGASELARLASRRDLDG